MRNYGLPLTAMKCWITEDEGGKPFTGLAYELYENGNLAYYCYYKNGFKEGNYVKFHHNGKVKSIDYMIKGQTRGIRKFGMKAKNSNMKERLSLAFV